MIIVAALGKLALAWAVAAIGGSVFGAMMTIIYDLTE